MSDNRRRTTNEQVEQRSASGVAIQLLNDVKQGAGWTAGALAVGDAFHQGKKLLVKSEKKELER